MKSAIEIKNLSKKYRKGSNSSYLTLRDSLTGLFHKRKVSKLDSDEFWALKDINLKIMPGEVVGIIGRNGAGKSTLLKILSRITHPTTGEVILRGRVGSLLEVGTGFHQELTGRENIYLNGAVLGMGREEINRKFDEIVAFAEITEFIDTPVKHYSSGMYMRLAFAVAAHLETEILIVDEVLAVGDIEFQKKSLGKMGDISRVEGKTILFVSHNLEAISQLCNNSIWLENGEIRKVGKTSEVINSYLSKKNHSNIHNLLTKRGVSVNFGIFDENDIEKYIFKSGENIKFVFTSNFDIEMEDACFNVVIVNNYGVLAAAIYGRDQVKELINISKSCKCSINWSKNYLAPGDYEIKISIYSRGKIWSSWDNVVNLSIIEYDYFNTGKILRKSPQICALPKCSWAVEAR